MDYDILKSLTLISFVCKWSDERTSPFSFILSGLHCGLIVRVFPNAKGIKRPRNTKGQALFKLKRGDSGQDIPQVPCYQCTRRQTMANHPTTARLS